MNKTLTTLFIILVIIFKAQSQSVKQRMAEKAYQNLQYATSSILFEELLAKDSLNIDFQKKLAFCYYKMNDSQKAEYMYRKVFANGGTDPFTLITLAEVLAKNGKYGEAKKFYQQFQDIQGSESAQGFLKAYAKLYTFYADSANFKIYYVKKTNSLQADFSPTPYKKGIVFVSARKEGIGAKRVYGWDNSAYLDLYYADTTGIDTLQFLALIKMDQLDSVSFSESEKRIIGHPDESYATSNDTKTLGYHGIYFASDTLWAKADSGNRAIPFHTKINTKYHEGPSCFVGDSIIYFTRNFYNGFSAKKSNDKTTNLNIYYSKKSKSGWSKPEMLPFCNKDYSVGHPTISKDGRTLYFCSNKQGGMGGVDIYKSTLDTSGKWSEPENLGTNINTREDELFPFIDSLNVLYFSSKGHAGLGGLDIFKIDLNQAKDLPQNMGYPINTRKDDFGLIISNDSKTGFISSNRKRGNNDDDIYYFTQNTFKPFKINIIVKAKLDSSIIQRANVKFVNASSNLVIKDTLSKSDGSFSYDFIKPSDRSTAFTFVAGKEMFYSDSLVFNKSFFARADGKTIDTVIYLDNVKYFTYCGKVLDKKKKKPVEGTTVFIFNTKTLSLDTARVGSDGRFCKNLDPSSTYVIKAEKENYFPDCHSIQIPDIKKITYSESDYLLNIQKVGIGTTFELKNLLYDLGKANIRADAAIVLDNLIKDVLEEFPTIKIELGAHTDSRGSDKFNQILSQKRADSAVAYITKHGIRKMRITSKGYGESKPLNKCKNGVKCTDEEFQINRRTEIKVTGFLKPSEYKAAGLDGYAEGNQSRFDVNKTYPECMPVKLSFKEKELNLK